MKYTATDTQTRKSNTSSQGSTLTATAPITKKYIKKGDLRAGGEHIYVYIYINIYKGSSIQANLFVLVFFAWPCGSLPLMAMLTPPRSAAKERRLRKQRSDARIRLRIAADASLLANHHASAVPMMGSGNDGTGQRIVHLLETLVSQFYWMAIGTVRLLWRILSMCFRTWRRGSCCGRTSGCRETCHSVRFSRHKVQEAFRYRGCCGSSSRGHFCWAERWFGCWCCLAIGTQLSWYCNRHWCWRYYFRRGTHDLSAVYCLGLLLWSVRWSFFSKGVPWLLPWWWLSGGLEHLGYFGSCVRQGCSRLRPPWLHWQGFSFAEYVSDRASWSLQLQRKNDKDFDMGMFCDLSPSQKDSMFVCIIRQLRWLIQVVQGVMVQSWCSGQLFIFTGFSGVMCRRTLLARVGYFWHATVCGGAIGAQVVSGMFLDGAMLRNSSGAIGSFFARNGVWRWNRSSSGQLHVLRRCMEWVWETLLLGLVARPRAPQPVTGEKEKQHCRKHQGVITNRFPESPWWHQLSTKMIAHPQNTIRNRRRRHCTTVAKQQNSN